MLKFASSLFLNLFATYVKGRISSSTKNASNQLWINLLLLPPTLYTTTFIIFESKQRIDESKKRLDCVKDTHRATRRFGVMAVRSPQSQIGDWNKKCYQISFLILFIL